VFAIYFMHRRVLPLEKFSWYVRDLAWPLGGAALATALLRQTVPMFQHRVLEFAALAAVSLIVLAVAALCAQVLRPTLLGYLRSSLVRANAP
jgi:EamA domain-containing membrane protein RarD